MMKKNFIVRALRRAKMKILWHRLEPFNFHIEYVKEFDNYCGGFYQEVEYGIVGCSDPFWFTGDVSIKTVILIVSGLRNSKKFWGNPRYFNKKIKKET